MEIITLGNDTLRKKSVLVPEINDGLLKFVNDMFEVMYQYKGIGLAAVQVGVIKRIFITHAPDDKPRVFINPEIIETSIEQGSYEEGCLSIPGVNAEIIRPYAVSVQAWNEKGRIIRLTAEGLLATVIQHENDHLNGKLFIDYIDQKKRKRLLKIN